MSARKLPYLILALFLVSALLPQEALAQSSGNADCRNLPNPSDDG